MRQPSYIALLESGELEQRIERLMEMLRVCRICPRDCDVDRLKNEVAACYSGLLPIVSAYTPHFGEEPALVGTRGSGNVFLGLCNLRCVYCQNYQISQTFKDSARTRLVRAARRIFLELQGRAAITSPGFADALRASGERVADCGRRGVSLQSFTTPTPTIRLKS